MLHVDEVIGQGGFGTVYQGRLETNDGLKRPVAIKVLSERMSQDSAAVARLRDEGRLLALIDHPAIVPVYAIQRVADRWAVVMGLVRGVELLEIQRDGPLSERAVIEIGIVVASALTDIWDHPHPETGEPLHVVHRDIKPQNLMLDTGGRVRILDFGIARAEFEAREAATMDGVAGTVAYMAPERWTKGGGGPASDVYALGVTMLELLTARTPERAGADQESHAAWLHEAARRLAMAGVAADVWEVLGGMLAFVAADRPTAREAAGQLRSLMARTSGDGLDAMAARRVEAALTRRAGARPTDNTLLGSHATRLGEVDDPTIPDGILASGWVFRPGASILTRSSKRMGEPAEQGSQRLALLLTDVVDSTKLSEQLGDAAVAKVWAAHDRVARDLLGPHHGREIDKTDGFLLLFDRAADAVAYALAYHRAIGELDPPMRARAGLHVGPVILTENAPDDVARGAKPLEVDGLAKPTAARAMGLATGGQTLLTAPARAALGTTSLRVESHGFWRMKGVSEPVELFEVGGPGAPFTPPPDGTKVYRVVRDGALWRPVKQVPHNLPSERDAFLGRSADLQELAGLLDGGAHLVSVLGIGGGGKTRFVTHYGWTWLGDWPGGVWFCDLSEARNVDGIAHAVARALDVPLGKDDPVVQLGHAIASRGRCLMLLDNFEQVARHANDTLGRWLDRAHDAQFVVTTREVLGLSGEHTLALPPLPLDEAVALFAERARAGKSDFTMSDADRPHVEALVRLLDSLPLAIELAAARVRVMAPKLLLQRMSERFKLLATTGGRHTRQATLRGALDWSWDLLSPDEQSALAQLSVFEGGFTLEAAEGVLALAEAWPMDAVQALVDKSLVRRVSDERLDLLVSVQEYAALRLDASGGRLAAETRHGAYFAGFGSDEAIDALKVHGGATRRHALGAEIDNLVAAARRAARRGEVEVAGSAVRAAWMVLSHRGPFRLGAELAREVLDAPDTGSPRTQVRLHLVLGTALQGLGRRAEAQAAVATALALARVAAATDPSFTRHLGDALTHQGTVHREQGRPDEATAVLDEALALGRRTGERSIEVEALAALGVNDLMSGRNQAALERLQAALPIYREVGNRSAEGDVLSNLGMTHLLVGRFEESRAYSEEALVAHREVGNRRHEANTLTNLGMLLFDLGRHDEARTRLEASLPMHQEVNNRRNLGVVSFGLGQLDLAAGNHDAARERIAATLQLAREIGDTHFEANAQFVLGDIHLATGRLDEARAALGASEALLRTVHAGADLGLVLCLRARLDRAQHQPLQARAALDEAEAIAAAIGCLPESGLGRALAKTRAAVAAP